MIAFVSVLGALAAALLAAVRMIGGPTLQDRVLAANLIVILCALMCGAVAVLQRAPSVVDVAFALLLAAYVVNLAVLKVFRLGTFQAALASKRAAD